MLSKTRVVAFPFDLFGGGGTARGAELLMDGLREMRADNRREQMPSRARAYQDHLSLHEVRFETMATYRSWRQRGRKLAQRVLEKEELLLWLAGNHLGVLPVLEALGRTRPDTLVLQLDAHLDIYNLSDCTSELSHGNFLLHAESPLPRLINVGHREQILTEAHIGKHFARHFPCAAIATNADAVVAEVRALCAAAPALFIDLDCDVFDLAFFPALAQPQPFGLSPQFVLGLIEAIWTDRVVGLSISEFDPARDQQDRSLALLLWLIEHVLLKRNEFHE